MMKDAEDTGGTGTDSPIGLPMTSLTESNRTVASTLPFPFMFLRAYSDSQICFCTLTILSLPRQGTALQQSRMSLFAGWCLAQSKRKQEIRSIWATYYQRKLVRIQGLQLSCTLHLLVKKLAVVKNNSATLDQNDDNLWVRMKEQKVQQQQEVMIIRSKNKTQDAPELQWSQCKTNKQTNQML